MEKIFHPLTQRRLRTDTHIRELTAGVKLSHKSFIQPLFIDEALLQPRNVEGLTNVKVETIASVLSSIEQDLKQGISKFLLFPVPARKQVQDFDFSFAASLIKSIKQHFGDDVWLAADLCLCSYTTHGHCGILNQAESKLINHKTVEVLIKYASQLAAAGVDCIAPSDMMDGRIAAIRTALEDNNYKKTGIMSYSAKYASCFYGPFRDALDSAPGFGDKKTYQMDYANRLEAIKETLMDVEEGADIVMIKPALSYLDIIREVKNAVDIPVSAYNISGEYAMIKAAAKMGWLDQDKAILETLTSIKRAGADLIATYFAKEAVKLIS